MSFEDIGTLLVGIGLTVLLGERFGVYGCVECRRRWILGYQGIRD